MYFGSYAVPIVETMKRLLRRGDVFLDVGANIGYLSAIAAGLVGADRGRCTASSRCRIIFARVQTVGGAESCVTRFDRTPAAAGEMAGSCKIYVTREPGQSTLVP